MKERKEELNLEEALRFINEAQSAEDLAEHLKKAGKQFGGAEFSASLLAARAAAGGVFLNLEELEAVGLEPIHLATVAESLLEASIAANLVEPERRDFQNLLLQNPNYFGNLEVGGFQPVKVIKANTSYEEMACLGLNPPFDRLEAVVRVKRNFGYGGTICQPGSREYVRFYVDLHGNGVLHDVGLGSVRVHDIQGPKPLCYAVFRDFDAIRKFCQTENVVKVRAILSWNVAPPPNAPNFVPVWGNRLDAQVQIRPRTLFSFGEIIKELAVAKVKIPDPVGPVVQAIDPETKLYALPAPAHSLEAKKDLYRGADVPLHRLAFSEVQQLHASATSADLFSASKTSALMGLGLKAAEVKGLFGSLLNTSGDTSFEELRCVGLKPDLDTLEAVFTLKKKNGYSGRLCGPGSTEYVAFWIDAGDGAGFQHVGTTSLNVHDLQSVPAGGLQYAVFLKTKLGQHLIPCQFGARVVRVRATLSWETSPPPGNPNWVPVWGNRLDCRVQLRPGALGGHIPLIETVGDVGVNNINQTNGLATGVMPIAGVSLNQAPFGLGLAITGRIGNPSNSFGGGAQPFKYRVEVAPDDGSSPWQPLTNKITVKKSEFVNGVPQLCAPGEFICDQVLTPTDDGDGLGPGWYPYIEDLTPPHQRFLVVDLLARWNTNANMEGVWKIRITAKDPSISPPPVFPGLQVIKVRIDNSAPTVSLSITSATFQGNPLPAVDCGKFPVGTIIGGTFSVHDPGTSAPFQHYGNTSFEVLPAGPAAGAAPTTVPAVRSFPSVGTTGLNGTWELNTKGMAACGYVLRMVGSDRTNVDSRGNHFHTPIAVGFCLE